MFYVYGIGFYVFISMSFDIFHDREVFENKNRKGEIGFTRVCTHDYAALHLDECNATFGLKLVPSHSFINRVYFPKLMPLTSANRVQCQTISRII